MDAVSRGNMYRIFFFFLLIPFLVPQFTVPVRWLEGSFHSVGTVVMWPRERSFILKLDTGERVGVSGITPPPAGQKIQLWGRYSVPEGSFATWMRGENLSGWVYASKVEIVSTESPWYTRVFTEIRARIRTALHPVAQAMLLGDRQVVGDVERFDLTGTSHLLAASGLHLSILCAFVYLALGRNRWTMVLILLLCVFYMTLTGFRVSMVRAAIMVALVFIPLPLHRFERLGIALVIILMIWPHAIFSVSLWLSFITTASILALFPILKRIGRWYPVSLLLTTTVAQVVAFPITIAVFERAAFPIGILANMLAVPLATLILSTAFIALIFPWPFKVPFVWLSHLASEGLLRWLEILS